jgi:drug/metabolite transporter (DMT)-like permease
MVALVPSSAPLHGIACMVAGGALLTANDALLKWLSADYPVGQILFVRGLFVMVPVGLLAWRTGGMAALRVRNPGGQALRAALVVVSAFCFVTALSLMPLAETIAIAFAGPLFITALAPRLLGETVGWRRWTAVVVGFAGVLLTTRPTAAGVNWIVFLPLGAALGGALRDIVTRRICVTESSPSIMLVTTAAVALAGLSMALFGWRPLAAADVVLLACTGFLLGGAHYLLIEAFRHAEAALVAPFKYTNLIWAGLIGFVLWGDVPDAWMAMGAALVIGSGLYIAHRETGRRGTGGGSEIGRPGGAAVADVGAGKLIDATAAEQGHVALQFAAQEGEKVPDAVLPARRQGP